MRFLRSAHSILRAATVGALLIIPCVSLAAGKGDEKTQARALLVEGGGLLQSGEYADALTRFEKAFALVPSPKIQYDIGLAYLGLGRPADALQAFEVFVAGATDAPAANLAAAKKYLAQLPKKVAVVELEGETAGAETSIDGRSYAAATRIVVNPGPHQITVDKPGQAPFLQKATVAAGDRLRIAVRFDRVVVTPPPPPPVITPVVPVVAPSSHEGEVDKSASGPTPRMRTVAFVGVGVAAALVAGSVAAGLTSNDKTHQFNDLKKADGKPNACNIQAPDFGGPQCGALHDSMHTWKLISIGAGVGAGLVAIGSIYLFVRASRHDSRETHVACAPSLGALGGVCRLTF